MLQTSGRNVFFGEHELCLRSGLQWMEPAWHRWVQHGAAPHNSAIHSILFGLCKSAGVRTYTSACVTGCQHLFKERLDVAQRLVALGVSQFCSNVRSGITVEDAHVVESEVMCWTCRSGNSPGLGTACKDQGCKRGMLHGTVTLSGRQQRCWPQHLKMLRKCGFLSSTMPLMKSATCSHHSEPGLDPQPANPLPNIAAKRRGTSKFTLKSTARAPSEDMLTGHGDTDARGLSRNRWKECQMISRVHTASGGAASPFPDMLRLSTDWKASSISA